MSYIASTFPLAVCNAHQVGGYTRPEKKPASSTKAGTTTIVQGRFVPARAPQPKILRKANLACSTGVDRLKTGLAKPSNAGRCHTTHGSPDNCQLSTSAQMICLLGTLMALLSITQRGGSPCPAEPTFGCPRESHHEQRGGAMFAAFWS